MPSNDFALDAGLPPVEKLQAELDEYRDVLMGREPYPVDDGLMTEMTVATVYYGRAKEMEALIHRGENERLIAKQSTLYKFRTGELRSFIEMAKAFMEKGSRTVTAAKLEYELEKEAI